MRGELVEVAATEHEEGEDGDEVEVDQLGDVKNPADEGAGPGGGEAERDGEVEVEGLEAEPLPGAGEKVGAADDEGEGGGGEGDQLEERGEEKVGLHAEVSGKAEGHGVHSEAAADAEAGAEGGGLGGGVRCLEEVAEGADFFGEGEGIKFGCPGEGGLSVLRKDGGAEGSFFLHEKLVEKPDAAEAGDAGDVELEAGGAVGLGG